MCSFCFLFFGLTLGNFVSKRMLKFIWNRPQEPVPNRIMRFVTYFKGLLSESKSPVAQR